MKKSLYVFVGSFLFLTACSLNPSTPTPSPEGFKVNLVEKGTEINTASSVSEKYIISNELDPSIEGEGFFVTIDPSTEIFVAGQFQDNPHDIENARRKFMAIIRGVNHFNYFSSEPMKVFLETKANLGVENASLDQSTYEDLAAEVRRLGKTKEISLVYFKDIEMILSEVSYPCSAIESVDPIVMTSGGLVYVFAVHFNDQTKT